jgi:prepilin-type processing-associated H-X9-DG protein
MQFRLSTLLLLFVVLWSSLAVFGATWGVGVFIAVVVLAIWLQKVEWPVDFPSMSIITVVLLSLLFLIGLLLPAVRSAREAPARSRCQSNLHNIALALLNYEAANGRFPPAWIADKDGRPVHSWRVLILPHLGYDDLYKQYDFSEPWDGPKNRKLLAARPSIYACPADKDAQAAGSVLTDYVAVVGRDAAWQGVKSRKLPDFTNGASTTIMVVEAADAAIPWTKPDDLSLDALELADPTAGAVTASSKHGDYQGFFYSRRDFAGMHAAFADGHVQYLSTGCLNPKTLLTLLRLGATDADFEKAESAYYRPPGWDDMPHPNWPNCLALLVWLASVAFLFHRAVRSRKPNRRAANPSA